MNKICKTLLATLLLLGVALTVAAQPRSVAEGNDPHRTRLIPYATDAAARERQLVKQRYMQPIVEWVAVEDGVLRGEFTYPFSWVERQVLLRVEHAAQPYEVWVNGKCAGGSTNGFAAAEYNITKLSREDKNSVELRLLDDAPVEKIECFDQEGSSSHPTVYIISQPRVRVRDIFWRTTRGKATTLLADFGVVMQNQTLGEKTSRIYYEIFLNDTIRLTGGQRDVALGMHGVDTMRFGASLPDSLLWSVGKSHNVTLHLKNRIGGRDVEFYALPVALRDLSYEGGKIYINGEELNIEWCKMSPTSSLADVESAYTAGCRAIRFTAGDVDDALLDYCDAQGICVALTAPINSSLSGMSRRRGGNPSNDPAWRKHYVERSKQLIFTTQRHPSVVAYYLADDSANGICLYESYLAMKAIANGRPIFYDGGSNEWNTD